MKKSLQILSTLLCFLLVCSIPYAEHINEANLETLIQFCDSTKADEVLISHKGKIIKHWRRTDFSNFSNKPGASSSQSLCGSPYMGTASMVKSWTSLLVGILINQKLIQIVDEPACKHLPEWKWGCKNNITIKHLLTMSAGYPRQGGRGELSRGNMNEYVLHLKPDTLPGVRFNYSNESVQLLGILIERVTNKKADQAFQVFLFKPLLKKYL